MYLIHVGPWTYIEWEKNWCTPYLKPKKVYGSFLLAKEACSVNEKCDMFYDRRGTKQYYLCGSSTRVKPSSKGSILYRKKGICILQKLHLRYAYISIIW